MEFDYEGFDMSDYDMREHYHTATKKLLGDTITPVSAYLNLRDTYPESMLLESSDYHGSENSKSFIGINPIASVSISHGNSRIGYPKGGGSFGSVIGRNPVSFDINSFLKNFTVEGEGKEYCGLYGYTSFNTVNYTENIKIKDETQDENDAPDVFYILYKTIIVFNHLTNEVMLIELLRDGEKDNLDKLERDLMSRNFRTYDFHPVGDYWSTITDDAHRENIRRCIQHCLRGDVFQIVISRRFCQKYEGDDFKLYRVLRSINPSPYLFYFDFGGFRIFGSSPETHCRIDGDTAYIDPIAGTTPRTGNTEQDRINAEYLRNDPKENAEHVMLVDLARNDLSRNCHDVHVDFYKDMQFYSHVIHLVSRVS